MQPPQRPLLSFDLRRVAQLAPWLANTALLVGALLPPVSLVGLICLVMLLCRLWVHRSFLGAAERARLESRVWRLKAQCARWRADLMAATQERFHAAVAEIEGRYAAVVASQADELARAREELCLHELRLGERNGAIEQARAGLRRAADERERRANNQS